MVRYYEDLALGDRLETGSIVVSAEAIVKFAREYDPQPMHLSEEAAKVTMAGQLIASGWQTASYAMRLLVDEGVFPPGGSLGLGVNALRWKRQVLPGDTLRVAATITALRASKTQLAGIVTYDIVVHNQHGEPVCTLSTTALVPLRPEPEASSARESA